MTHLSEGSLRSRLWPERRQRPLRGVSRFPSRSSFVVSWTQDGLEHDYNAEALAVHLPRVAARSLHVRSSRHIPPPSGPIERRSRRHDEHGRRRVHAKGDSPGSAEVFRADDDRPLIARETEPIRLDAEPTRRVRARRDVGNTAVDISGGEQHRANGSLADRHPRKAGHSHQSALTGWASAVRSQFREMQRAEQADWDRTTSIRQTDRYFVRARLLVSGRKVRPGRGGTCRQRVYEGSGQREAD